MKVYLAILRARFSALFQYRAAAFAGLVTQLFWGIIKSMILTAFYVESGGPQPITLAQAITFIWIGQALIQLLPWNIDKEDEDLVRTGNVVYLLTRPIDLYWFLFYRSMAIRIVPTLFRCLPLFTLAYLFFGLTAPISLNAFFLFLFSLILSLFVSTAITAAVAISLFWTISGEGIKRLLPHMVVFLSGMIVPLPLFPDWLQPFLSLQPFRCIIDIPCRIYTGVIPASESFWYLGLQAVWALIFVRLGMYLVKKATRHLVVQGG